MRILDQNGGKFESFYHIIENLRFVQINFFFADVLWVMLRFIAGNKKIRHGQLNRKTVSCTASSYFPT